MRHCVERWTKVFSSDTAQRILFVLREVRLSIVHRHSASTGQFSEILVHPNDQRQRLAGLSGESSRSNDECIEESRRVRGRTFSIDLRQSVGSLVSLVHDAFLPVRRVSAIGAQ